MRGAQFNIGVMRFIAFKTGVHEMTTLTTRLDVLEKLYEKALPVRLPYQLDVVGGYQTERLPNRKEEETNV